MEAVTILECGFPKLLRIYKTCTALAGVAQLVGVTLQNERSPAPCPVREHAWVAGWSPVGNMQEATDVSPSH